MLELLHSKLVHVFYCERVQLEKLCFSIITNFIIIVVSLVKIFIIFKCQSSRFILFFKASHSLENYITGHYLNLLLKLCKSLTSTILTVRHTKIMQKIF